MKSTTGMAILQDESQIRNPVLPLAEFFTDFIEKPTRAIMHQRARFLLIEKGEGTILVDGQGFPLKAPCLIAISPYSITDIVEVNEPLSMEIISYDYRRLSQTIKGLSGSNQDKADLLTHIHQNPVVILNDIELSAIQSVYGILRVELTSSYEELSNQEKPLRQIYILNKLIELVVLYRRYSSDVGNTRQNRNVKDTQHILSYMYAHSFDKLTLEKLSTIFYLSESKIIKTIHDLTGLTFGELIERIQMDKLKSILLYTDMNLDEIAHLMGYVDASHVSKHFVQTMGINPIAFRKQYQSLSKGESQSNQELAFQVAEYIYNHYNDPSLTISRMASKFGVSEKQLNTAMTFFVENKLDQLLHKVRIHKACELILMDEETILDVALDVGYSNVKTFNIHFNEIIGMSPSVYRKTICLQLRDGKELKSQN
ncbi:AraC family transcriptional regulator [Bulleidia sp. zg-1006]|uniref:AraC family transcriptional regulator n=1 Tax=Bulleidia sp. zg-1006 TaxID=2806552 RepID=UPI001939FA4C|nr:AraC family transcriptional regulator [Bulleidia sp. zg-1006]QRG87076.1 helix-turn-helix domain-containing protein [Bulleidia sp. zg-1006]